MKAPPKPCQVWEVELALTVTLALPVVATVHVSVVQKAPDADVTSAVAGSALPPLELPEALPVELPVVPPEEWPDEVPAELPVDAPEELPDALPVELTVVPPEYPLHRARLPATD